MSTTTVSPSPVRRRHRRSAVSTAWAGFLVTTALPLAALWWALGPSVSPGVTLTRVAVPDAVRPPGEFLEISIYQGTPPPRLFAWFGVTGRLDPAGVQRQFDARRDAALAADRFTGTRGGPVGAGIGQMGGSSGLVLALAGVDVRTDGALDAGLRVAATGTIDVDGAVGVVGWVEEKAAGAADWGADVLFVPTGNADAARAVAADRLVVVAVDDLGDAVAWLCRNGADDVACPPLTVLR